MTTQGVNMGSRFTLHASRFTKQGGFTLLELLMVVIIIGILASIAMPQYFKTVEKTRSAEAFQILAVIRGSEMRYRAQNPLDTYTTNPAALDVTVPTSTPQWTFVVANGTVSGADAVATRTITPAGCTGTTTIQIDLDAGGLCTSCPTVYGIGAC